MTIEMGRKSLSPHGNANDGPQLMESEFGKFITCHGCKHLAFNDVHYPYCSGQDAPNQHENKDGYYYPWKGAGVHIGREIPNLQCPYFAKYQELAAQIAPQSNGSNTGMQP